MSVTADFVKDFFNRHFFDQGGNPVQVKAKLSIQVGDSVLSLPEGLLCGYHSLQDIVQAYHDSLLYKKEATTPPVAPISAPAALRDFEKMTFNKHDYLVAQLRDGSFQVTRMDTGQVMSPQSPVSKVLVKRWVEGKD